MFKVKFECNAMLQMRPGSLSPANKTPVWIIDSESYLKPITGNDCKTQGFMGIKQMLTSVSQ